MTEELDTARFAALTSNGGDRHLAQAQAAAVRAGDQAAAIDLAAMFTHVAVVAPERLVEIYDGAAAGWFGTAPAAPVVVMPALPEPLSTPSPEFWDTFWALVLDPDVAKDAGEITARTASLSGMVDPSFGPQLIGSLSSYPGVEQAAAGGMPTPFTLEALARCPKGSLGGDLHDLIVDNGFDLEVLDRSTLGLTELPAPLGYLNSRILQCHDLWHLLAGYRTTALHEVAISGFQLGQFGHHYSSVFLAVTMTKVAVGAPVGLPIVLDTILSAYVHGRETPPLLGLPWETIWHLTAEQLRADYGVATYVSPWPADLFEQLSAA
jgi:ubiquinone biosynthesis protein Coq4